MMSFLRIYKKHLYINDKKVFKLSKKSLNALILKLIWVSIIGIMILTMVFGSIGLLTGSSTNPTNTVPINFQ